MGSILAIRLVVNACNLAVMIVLVMLTDQFWPVALGVFAVSVINYLEGVTVERSKHN